MGTLIGIFIFLLLSAFFSGSEIAFVSASKLGVAMDKESGSRRAKIISSFYQNPKNFISTMLVGNNIALVAFTYFMTSFLESILPGLVQYPIGSLLTFTLIITIVVLIFGEFMPKTFFRLYSKNILQWLAFPLYFFKWLLVPPTWMMNSLSDLFLKIFKIDAPEASYALSKVDVQNYLEEQISEQQEEINKEILTNAMQLSELKVRDAMVPRTEMVSFDISENQQKLIELIRETKLSRIILTDGEIENVMGYIHHQQLLSKPKNLKKIAIDLAFVPEAMNLQDLLTHFIISKTSLACVVDEYGSVAGIITLEDIVEEIFGDIEDEFDEDELLEQQLSPSEYIFSGRLEIDYINEKYDAIQIPEGDYQTLAGYIVMTSGAIPETDDDIIIENCSFKALQVSDKLLEIVRLTVLSPEEPNTVNGD